MTSHDPMTSSIRREMDRYQSAWGNAPKPRTTVKAPAFLFEDSAEVKARKVAGLLKAREELRDLMVARGVTADRIAAMTKYNDQLISLRGI